MIQEQCLYPQTKPWFPAETPVSLANILVATDFTETSDRALEHALTLARTYNSKIFLAHIIAMDPMMAPELVDVAREQLSGAAREGMSRTLAPNRFIGVSHEEIIQEGALWPSIEALIGKYGINLIVVGTQKKATRRNS